MWLHCTWKTSSGAFIRRPFSSCECVCTCASTILLRSFPFYMIPVWNLLFNSFLRGAVKPRHGQRTDYTGWMLHELVRWSDRVVSSNRGHLGCFHSLICFAFVHQRPLVSHQFLRIYFTYHTVQCSTSLSTSPLISPSPVLLYHSPNLFSHPTLSVLSFRALFLGLSNNPHITDLHLDISSCEVRSACAAPGIFTHLFID